VLAGVCQGAGRYFGVDPVIFRVVLAVLSLTGGIGLIVYGLGWLVIPQEGEEESEAHRLLSGRIEGAPLTAVLMALVGCGLYASMLGNGTNQAFSLVLLAATAGAVYWSQQRHRVQATGEVPAAGTAASVAVDAPPAVQAPPEPGGTPSWWRGPAGKEPYLWGPDDGPYGDPGPSAKGSKGPKRPKVRRERVWVLPLLSFLLAVAAAAVGAGVSWPYQPAGVSAEIGLAAALGVFGVAFLVASFAGRTGGGHVFLSLLVVAGLIGAATLPRSGQGAGSTTWRPATAAAVQPQYERGAGTGTLDLTRLPLTGRTVTTHLDIGVGEAHVRLPKDANVKIDYDIGIGRLDVSGDHDSAGVRLRHRRHELLTYAPAPGTLSTGTIDLRVTVGVGQVTVIR